MATVGPVSASVSKGDSVPQYYFGKSFWVSAADQSISASDSKGDSGAAILFLRDDLGQRVESRGDCVLMSRASERRITAQL